jgi:uncharacterized membrane protein
MKVVSDEPVLTAITGLIAATAGLLAAFGVNLTDEQLTALLAFIPAVYAVALVVRHFVTPTKKLAPPEEP